MPGKTRRKAGVTPSRPARHNPLAQQLADRRFAKRVVEVKKGAYRRRPKHPKGGDEADD